MNPKELKEYIDEKAPNAYETFFASAKEYQNEKNQKIFQILFEIS